MPLALIFTFSSCSFKKVCEECTKTRIWYDGEEEIVTEKSVCSVSEKKAFMAEHGKMGGDPNHRVNGVPQTWAYYVDCDVILAE